MSSASWYSEMNPSRTPLSAVVATTNTLHVAYRPGMTDRGNLYEFFRSLPGFKLVGFYDTYCFVRFYNRQYATLALTSQPHGCVTYEPAKLAYEVPYPQPQDDNVPPCKTLHVTHLPPNYTKEEIHKIFRVFEGFLTIQLHGKYGYAYFASEDGATEARTVLRAQTNLVVSFAKNAARNAYHPDSIGSRNKGTHYQSSYAPRIQSSAPNDVNSNLLAAVFAKCSISEAHQVKQAQEPLYMNHAASRSASMLKSLDLGAGETSGNESASQLNASSQSSYSPPPLSPAPSMSPGTAYSDYPWTRRSSADSALSGNSSYSPSELSSQPTLNLLSANNSFSDLPKTQSIEYQEQILLQQRLQLLQLQYLQQQQMLQLQKQNEWLQAARMRKTGYANEGIWDNAPYGAYGAIGQNVQAPAWSAFDSKLGFAVPTGRV